MRADPWDWYRPGAPKIFSWVVNYGGRLHYCWVQYTADPEDEWTIGSAGEKRQ